MKKNTGVRYALYLMMFTFGLTVTMIAPMMPNIIEEFKLTLSEGGYLSLFSNLGGLAGIVLSAYFADRFRKSYVFRAAFALMCVSLAALALIKGYYLMLLGFFIAGIGGKTVDTMAYPIMAQNYPQGTTKYLTLMHMFISLGGLTSPVCMSLLMRAGLAWREAFGVFAAFGFAVYLAASLLFRTERVSEARSGGGSFKALLRDRVFVLACVIMFFYCGHQVIINVWAPTFMQKVYNVGSVQASLSTTLFWVGMAVGRLVAGALANERNAYIFISAGSLLAAIVILVCVFLPYPGVCLAAFAFAGLTSGSVFPLLVDSATRAQREQAARASSVIYLCSTAAVTLFPSVCASVSESFGLRVGMALSGAALIVVFALSLAFGRVIKAQKTALESDC